MRRIVLRAAVAAVFTSFTAAALHDSASAQGRARIILYQEDNYRGQQMVVDGPIGSLKALHFNDRVSSVRVVSGTWLLCADDQYRGDCFTVRGDEPKLGRQGFDDRLSSLRPIGNDRRDDRGGQRAR